MNKIFEEIGAAGGHALIVGGYVRDKVMGLEPKDMDIEVYSLSAERLSSLLSRYGTVNAVGASFGVLKLKIDGQEYDFTLPRRENKQGRGHKGFQVVPDPTMSITEAAFRRDFTMNSMAYDPLNGTLYDYFGGQNDIKNKILRPTSPAFKEDALRVLRGMQFASRFDMRPSFFFREYANILMEEYKDLSIERIWGEWQKLVEKGVKPSAGLKLLEETFWVNLYPELQALIGVPQEPEWHPEGPVNIHTGLVADEAAAIADREGLNAEGRSVLVLAAICHDFAKPQTTQVIDGRIRSPGHEAAGVPLAESFLQSIGCPQGIIDQVKPLVANHLIHINPDMNARIVRRLAVRLEPSNIYMLSLLIEADASGRPPLPKGMPAGAARMLALSATLKVSEAKPKGILSGKHLLAKGLQPGPVFGIILREAYQLELDGVIANEAEAESWLEKRLDNGFAAC